MHPAARALAGRVTPPGDKSVSHRSAILGGLATGTTHIEGFLEAEDTLATLDAMADLGACVTRDGAYVQIQGGRLSAPSKALDLGNSGTGMRLLAGALCGHPELFGAKLELIGDASLSRRPMQRIIEPLSAMGARIESRDGHAPLIVEPRALRPAHHELKVASAQVKSAILLAGLNAAGETRVVEPGVSRDHTERLLPAFGVTVDRGEREARVSGPARLKACRVTVPGDLSSAAFLIAAAILVPGSRIDVGPVGVNPTRDGFLRIVERMAAGAVRAHPIEHAGAGTEAVANLEIAASSQLLGSRIPAEWVPLSIDEFPLVMAMAAAGAGETVISGARELRVKESDRLDVMCRQLARLGVDVEQRDDGAVIRGGRIGAGVVSCEGDHRIAMSLAVLALVAEGPVEIDGAEWIRTSYPDFVRHFQALGAQLQWH